MDTLILQGNKLVGNTIVSTHNLLMLEKDRLYESRNVYLNRCMQRQKSNRQIKNESKKRSKKFVDDFAPVSDTRE